MPRSSRHKSQRQKHSSRDIRGHSGSEEDEFSRERKRGEDSAIRASYTSERRESPSKSHQEKDLPQDYSGSKRRRDREDSAVNDRWIGGEDRQAAELTPEKRLRGHGFGFDSEKRSNSKVAEDSKNRSSRRAESSCERKNEVLVTENEDSKKGSSRSDSKRKSDKDSGSKDGKEKERGRDRDRKVHDSRRERSVDISPGKAGVCSETSRKQGRTGGSAERHPKREVENTVFQMQEESRNPESEKELEKHTRRCDGSSVKDKHLADIRDSEDRQFSSREDHLKNSKCKDEKQKDGKYRDKYREEDDGDQRSRDEKHKYERSVDRTIERSDKSSDSRHRKAKLQGNNSDCSPNFDNQGVRNEEIKGRKRPLDKLDDCSDYDSRSTKEHNINVEKNSLNSRKLDSVAERCSESYHHNSDVMDHSSHINNILKSSASSSTQAIKDLYRHDSKKAESRAFVEERYRSNALSTREVLSIHKGNDKMSNSANKSQEDKGHSSELFAESVDGNRLGRSPKRVQQSSPNQSTGKSSSSGSGARRYTDKTGVTRASEAEELGWRSMEKAGKDYKRSRDWESPLDKTPMDDHSKAELDIEVTHVSSANRLANRSPSIPPPFRHGIDSPSVLGSTEEESLVASDHKSSNRIGRSGDSIMGRGHGNAWKGIPNWPSPMANGFIPLQPPHSGFHAVMPHFSANLFGVRPNMELSHQGVSFPMHDAERFSGHQRPYGWRASPNDPGPSSTHGWDENNGVLGDESKLYGRSDWDHNRHAMSSRSWEMNVDIWKGQNGSAIMASSELPSARNDLEYSAQVSSSEHQLEHDSQQSNGDRNQLESFPTDKAEVKRTDANVAEISAGENPKNVGERTPESSKVSIDNSDLCSMYLSRLDISVDLVSPELYKQYICLSKSKEGSSDVEKQTYPEDSVKEFRRVSHAVTNYIFPRSTETIFQRALDLYKKQKSQMKKEISALSGWPKVEEVSQPSVDEEQIDVSRTSPPVHHLLASGSSGNEEVGDDAQPHTQANPSDYAKDQQPNITGHNVSCQNISPDDSQAFDACMPDSVECRVNLSRIHISPESTH